VGAEPSSGLQSLRMLRTDVSFCPALPIFRSRCKTVTRRTIFRNRGYSRKTILLLPDAVPTSPLLPPTFSRPHGRDEHAPAEHRSDSLDSRDFVRRHLDVAGLRRLFGDEPDEPERRHREWDSHSARGVPANVEAAAAAVSASCLLRPVAVASR